VELPIATASFSHRCGIPTRKSFSGALKPVFAQGTLIANVVSEVHFSS
jgi:hypothetical protein